MTPHKSRPDLDTFHTHLDDLKLSFILEHYPDVVRRVAEEQSDHLSVIEGEGLRADDGRHRDFDPLLTRPFVTAAGGAGHAFAQTHRTCHTFARHLAGLAETRFPLVRRVAQNCPHRRALPARRRCASLRRG